jgi:UDP:flavonoid glycosyltransferase YjiC (YdhE family)
VRALVLTWGPGGNLPPMLAAADLLVSRGHEVTVMASGATRGDAQRLGVAVVGFRRTPDPDVGVAFEAQAELAMATAAGAGIALDTREAIEAVDPDVVVIDCMLPGALAAGRATGTPTASLVHFLYGAARRHMLEAGVGWTTDLPTLAGTYRTLGLPPFEDAVAAWEAPDLVLVTAPRWVDVDAGAPAHVVHAGPLGVRPRRAGRRRDALLTFSSTVMDGQPELIDRVCEAVAGLGLSATLTLGPAVERAAVTVPDGIEVLAVADHDRLMPECALVICHGGLGTVLRAFAHGIPMVVLPLGRDQVGNARRVAELGVGMTVPADAQRIRDAVQTVLGDASFRGAAARAAERIAADEPDRAAAEAIEGIARR